MYKFVIRKILCVFAGIVLLMFPSNTLSAQEITSYNGLMTITAETSNGTITLLIPEDLQPGSHISGKVIVLPASLKPKQQEKQRIALKSSVVKIGDTEVKGDGMFEVVLPELLEIAITLTDDAGRPLFSHMMNLAVQKKATAPQIPKILRKGFTERITGPFSGSYQDITLSVGSQPADLLAASGNTVFFECPDIKPGQRELIIETPEIHEIQEVNVVDLTLFTGQTDLLPGQQTQITVTITGLQGVKDTLDLNLSNLTTDVIEMEDGNSQVISLIPDEIPEAGVWRRTFTITGKQRGDFSITSDLTVPEEEPAEISDPERIVDCDLDGYPVLVPAYICEQLQNRIPEKPTPFGDLPITEPPVHAEYSNLPYFVETGSQLPVTLSLGEAFIPHFVLFETFRLTDCILVEATPDTIPEDGFGYNADMNIDPGIYVTRANIHYGSNQLAQVQSYIILRDKTYSSEIEYSPEVSRVEERRREVERQSAGLRARLEMLERERRRLDSLITVERNHAREYENMVRQLEAIDQPLDTVEGLYSIRLRRLLDSLAGLPSVPDSFQLQALEQEVERLESALAECLSQLERLQGEQDEIQEQIPALEQERINAYRKIFGYLKQTGYDYAGHRRFNAQGDMEYSYGIILRAGDKIDYMRGVVPIQVASEINEQDKKIEALNRELRQKRGRLNELPGLIQNTQQQCDRIQELVNQARENLASGKELADRNASFHLQRDELCREIKNLLARLLLWCDQHPDLCTFRDQLNRFLEECPNDSMAMVQFWNHFNGILAAKRGVEEQQQQQADQHRRNESTYRDQRDQVARNEAEAENELEGLARELDDLNRQRQAAAEQARRRLEREAREREQREREEVDDCVRIFAQWVADNQEHLDDDNLDELQAIKDVLQASAEAAAGITAGMASGATTGASVTSGAASGIISLGASILYGWFQSAATATVKKIADRHVLDLINAQLINDNRKCGEFDPDPPPPPTFFFFRKGGKLLLFRITDSHGLEFLGETTSF